MITDTGYRVHGAVHTYIRTVRSWVRSTSGALTLDVIQVVSDSTPVEPTDHYGTSYKEEIWLIVEELMDVGMLLEAAVRIHAEKARWSIARPEAGIRDGLERKGEWAEGKVE